MKKLEPKTITYTPCICEHCGKRYRNEKRCITHEDKCFSNPNRNCPNCKNTGADYYDKIPCGYCQHASEMGGKSYITTIN